MRLKEKSLEAFKTIIHRDYGIDLTDEDANLLGVFLLRLSSLAMSALNKADEHLLAKPIIN